MLTTTMNSGRNMDILPEMKSGFDPEKMSEAAPLEENKEALEMIVEPLVKLETSCIAATLTFKTTFLTSTT